MSVQLEKKGAMLRSYGLTSSRGPWPRSRPTGVPRTVRTASLSCWLGQDRGALACVAWPGSVYTRLMPTGCARSSHQWLSGGHWLLLIALLTAYGISPGGRNRVVLGLASISATVTEGALIEKRVRQKQTFRVLGRAKPYFP